MKKILCLLLILALFWGTLSSAASADTENGSEARTAQDVTDVLEATLAQLRASVTIPAFGTNAGEWTVLCLARGGYLSVDDPYFDDYYERITETVILQDEKLHMNGALHKSKSTDNSRLILALSAIGKDATSVGGIDLIEAYSANGISWITKQGINGAIFALIALDTRGYETSDPTVREQCISFILNKRLEDGGWALSGKTTDPDITAMALQALAPYRERTEVAQAAEAAFLALSSIQREDGGFASWGTVNSESCAQVIVACAAFGINPDTDPRFIKSDASVVDALLSHYLPDSAAFEHVKHAGANGMATDQACYALIAYDRQLKGMRSLYDCRDAAVCTHDYQEKTENGSKTYTCSLCGDQYTEITDPPSSEDQPDRGAAVLISLSAAAVLGALICTILLRRRKRVSV